MSNISGFGLYRVASTQGVKCGSGGDIGCEYSMGPAAEPERVQAVCVCRGVLEWSPAKEESAEPKSKTGQN